MRGLYNVCILRYHMTSYGNTWSPNDGTVSMIIFIYIALFNHCAVHRSVLLMIRDINYIVIYSVVIIRHLQINGNYAV